MLVVSTALEKSWALSFTEKTNNVTIKVLNEIKLYVKRLIFIYYLFLKYPNNFLT